MSTSSLFTKQESKHDSFITPTTEHDKEKKEIRAERERNLFQKNAKTILESKQKQLPRPTWEEWRSSGTFHEMEVNLHLNLSRFLGSTVCISSNYSYLDGSQCDIMITDSTVKVQSLSTLLSKNCMGRKKSMVTVGTPGHISVALINHTTSNIEYFDSNGVSVKYLGTVVKTLNSYFPEYTFLNTNTVNIQEGTGEYRDLRCQTWILCYVYCREVIGLKPERVVNVIISLPTKMRFELIDTFWRFLLYGEEEDLENWSAILEVFLEE